MSPLAADGWTFLAVALVAGLAVIWSSAAALWGVREGSQAVATALVILVFLVAVVVLLTALAT